MYTKDMEHVLLCINNEGFDYCFNYYTNFPDIQDNKFHELISVYKKSRDKLKYYIDSECKRLSIDPKQFEV